MVNLKDKSNPGLRESIVSGDLSTSELATMSTEDMASEERKAQNQEIQKQNLFNSLAAGEQEAETDAFKCGRCKQVRWDGGGVESMVVLTFGFSAQVPVSPAADPECGRAYDCAWISI
jgi:hypothetical protein